MKNIKKIAKPDNHSNFTASKQLLIPSIERYRKPIALAPFRRLQFIACGFAIIWLVVGIFTSAKVIDNNFQETINEQQKKANREATFIAQLIDKELHTAEQLAITLSHEADILTHLQSTNLYSSLLYNMTQAQRNEFLKKHPPTAAVNNLFKRISNDVDLMSVFLLDASANCIANSYFTLSLQHKAKGCLGANYVNRHYFQQAKAEGQGRQFAVGKKIPIPSLFFAHASTKEEQFMGTVVVRLNANKLMDGLKLLSATTWVVDNQGIIISSTDKSAVFKHIGEQFLAKPSKQELQDTYALDAVTPINIKPSAFNSRHLNLWDINHQTMVIARINTQGQDFKIWHAIDVKQSLILVEQNWYLAATIIIAGLLLILMVERASDYHQRSLSHLDNLARVNRSLEKASNELYSIAITDHLTQISSRGYFLQRLEEEVTRAHLEQRPLCLLQIDIDHFKKINDSLGHAAGDAAISHMANLCRTTIRDADLLGRMGGEEFSISLIDCDIEKAMHLAEYLRHACEHSTLNFNRHTIQFTCSIGVACLNTKQAPDELLTAADKGLYMAKNAGRNCVKFYTLKTKASA